MNFIFSRVEHEKSFRAKSVLSDHLKLEKTMVLMEYGSLMKVESIAECILQYFRLALSVNRYWKPISGVLLSGRLR